MRNRITYTLLFFILLLISSRAQECHNVNPSNSEIEFQLWKDIRLLASDSLEGRESGTRGEVMARDYIINRFIETGLKPFFSDNSYIQPFEFKSWGSYDHTTELILNNRKFKLDHDFYPMSYSSNGEINAKVINTGFGIEAPELNFNDYKGKKDLKGKVFVMEISVPEGFQSRKFSKYNDLDKRIQVAIRKGAIAVIFINSDPDYINPFRKINPNIAPSSIPVIFAGEKVTRFLKKQKETDCYINVNITRTHLSAYNVAGYLHNNAGSTIIIGAHYDHLGIKNAVQGNKTYSEVYNGADDNASGIAGLIELARFIKQSGNKKSNYLFIAFSGEEKGFLGSKFFLESNTLSLSAVKCMLNIDMIGRLDSSNTLYIVGTGSSKWENWINLVDNKNLNIIPTNNALGGSDQLPFYLKSIPVLFFFNGIHTDYHTPHDDPDKINIKGEISILNFIKDFIIIIDTVEVIPFQVIDEVSSLYYSNKNNSIGLLPDKEYSGKGIRIEAIIKDLLAYNAGLQPGDVIIKVDDREINDYHDFTEILKNYYPGTKAKVLVSRMGTQIIKMVNF